MVSSTSATMWQQLAPILLLIGLSACSYEGLGPIEDHYQTFATRLPANNKVFVCSAYGCRTQSEFKFTSADLTKMRSLMAVPKKGGGSAAEERRNIARALAWIEKRVGDAVGTSA